MEKDIHDARYIYWQKEAKALRLHQAEWNIMMDELEAKGKEMDLGVGKNTIRSHWMKNRLSYSISEDKKYTRIYVCSTKGKGYDRKTEYNIFFTYRNEDKDEKEQGLGIAGCRLVDKDFKELYGVSLRVGFGVVEKDYDDIRHCAVAAAPLIYVVPKWMDRVYSHGYKADISSAYPDCLRGLLPDWHTVEKKPGRVEPNEEYPFIFWNDGHSAEYQGYDTREFVKNKWFLATNDKGNNKLVAFKSKEPLVSYCCKASKYKLTETMEYIYRKKEMPGEDRQKWKDLFVAFIGKFFEETPYSDYKHPHLATVCHGRQIKKMLDITAALEAEGNIPISFATDSIIWCGKGSKTTTNKEDKVLGSFVSEFEDADFAFAGVGVYAMSKDNIIGIIKHQGQLENKYKEVKTLEEFLQVAVEVQEYRIYNKRTRRYITTWRI